jgi:hypothetical protein
MVMPRGVSLSAERRFVSPLFVAHVTQRAPRA